MIALEQARQYMESLGMKAAVEVLDSRLDAAASKQLTYPEMVATLSCSPFSTAVIEGSGHSVLIGTCPVLRTDERDNAVKGPSLWSWLFGTREFQFLVRDLSELK